MHHAARNQRVVGPTSKLSKSDDYQSNERRGAVRPVVREKCKWNNPICLRLFPEVNFDVPFLLYVVGVTCPE